MLRRLILAILMLSALSSCGEYFKQAPHSWEGTITLILSPFISTAHAADNICRSTCTSTKCAYLIEHTNSTTSRTICATNADTKYKFEFSEDPNKYFAGKMIEISIRNPFNCSQKKEDENLPLFSFRPGNTFNASANLLYYFNHIIIFSLA